MISNQTSHLYRWYINRNQPEKAFRSFQRLRFTNIQAARDTYYTYVGVQMENKIYKRKSYVGMLIELFRVPRNRRAALASWILMFGQQLCGVSLSSLLYLKLVYNMQMPSIPTINPSML